MKGKRQMGWIGGAEEGQHVRSNGKGHPVAKHKTVPISQEPQVWEEGKSVVEKELSLGNWTKKSWSEKRTVNYAGNSGGK